MSTIYSWNQSVSADTTGASSDWALIYDTMYAMVDRDDDLRIGVKSTAILFGKMDRLIMGILQVLMLGLLFQAGQNAGLGSLYHGGLLGGLVFFVYQQWLIRKREKALCFKAFLNNNWFGASIFIGIALDYAMAFLSDVNWREIAEHNKEEEAAE